ncbi:MAG: hypothetical protein IPG80_02100 [Anaerolineales bacterium]|uniref:restriction endonuclease subunit S n=1 Tax=Candidatus Villigracilis vicinus TaxID=3140679 RepID=UPI0031373B4B|nr:hypothetical protein [Anaerolineales bacterium]
MGKRYLDKHGFEKKRWSEIKKGYTHFADGDVLLARITPSFENGKGGIVQGLPNGIGAGSTEYFVCRPRKELLHPKYLLALFKTYNFLQDGARVMQGAVGQQRVPKQYVLEHEIPLPPLDEQNALPKNSIPARPRGLVPDSSGARPANSQTLPASPCLRAAASGRLTEDWREEQKEVEMGRLQRILAKLFPMRNAKRNESI